MTACPQLAYVLLDSSRGTSKSSMGHRKPMIRSNHLILQTRNWAPERVPSSEVNVWSRHLPSTCLAPHPAPSVSMDIRNDWIQKPRSPCSTQVSQDRSQLLCTSVHTQGIKYPLPKLELKCNVNGMVIKTKLLNLLSLKQQRKKSCQIHRNWCSLLRKKKSSSSNFSRVKISTVQRGLASLSSQMFGSHSKYENCLFPPTLKTPPHPRTLAALPKLWVRAKRKYSRVWWTVRERQEDGLLTWYRRNLF